MEDVVPEVPTDGWNLNAEQVTKIINRKKNWSSPGPDRIANFWWKKATILHKEIATCFQATAQLEDLQFPLWFSEGETTLIPKPGEFRSDNQRPITCLNNLYKWYTSCLLAQANQRIETYGLIQREQRGARGNCSGTVENLLIDRMVCKDAQRRKRNLNMAWIDVAKAYNSVDHGWISEMFILHRFPITFAKVMEKLANTGTLELLPKRPKAKRSLLQYVLRKDLPKVMRSDLCCSYCAWIQSHERYGRLRVTSYLSLYQLTSLTYYTSMTWSCLLLLRTSWNESWQSRRMEWKAPVSSRMRRSVQWYTWRGDKSSKEVEILR